jgi:hypothetical protein
MKYYFWCNGYEYAGIVKADDIDEAKHKVIMSQGECTSIDVLDDTYFDSYDVGVLVSK